MSRLSSPMPIGPHSAALHHSLGLALIRERRYDDAIAHAREAGNEEAEKAYLGSLSRAVP